MTKKLSITFDLSGAIIGTTRTGKTALANMMLKVSKPMVLVIDIADIGQYKGKKFTHESKVTDLINTLRKDRRAVYKPKYRDKKKLKEEILYLWDMLCWMHEHIIVFVDETQHYGDSANNLFDQYAVQGLKYGIHLVAMSQRVATISKTIMNNVSLTIWLDQGDYEEQYFKGYGLMHVFEEVKELQTLPKHSFKIYEKGVGMSPAMKLSKVDT